MPRSSNTRTRLIWREGKKVRAHRWIMEQHLGRKLETYEHVHHINGDPLDNRIENLTVLPSKEHMQLHKQVYPDVKPCAHCGREFTVNPRKRKRSKCCSTECAQSMRVNAALVARGLR
jgi:hypothetical protein